MSAPTYRLIAPPRPARIGAPTLDGAQQAVVDHREGSLVVLAGPGTGKSTTLVEAVVERVDRRGVDPADVLVLTFGRRAAGEIRDRIAARLGRTVREPVARTFHSYAFGLLRIAAVHDGEPSPRLLAGPEQDMIVRELLAGDASTDRLLGGRPWPAQVAAAVGARGFAGELRDLLLRAAERGADADDLVRLGQEQSRPDWARAGEFLRQYREVTSLSAVASYDPAELIRAAIARLESDRRLRQHPAANPRIVVVDEYQDTDPAQARLLELIANGARELIVVGDPDQSIYAFRGADPTAMIDAPERFAALGSSLPGSSAELIELSTSRRSGSRLLDATRAIATRLPGPRRHRDVAAVPQAAPGEVEVRLLRTAHEEAEYVAYVLRRAHLQQDVAWSRMAVLVRSTSGSTMPVLRRALLMAGVPAATDEADLPLIDQPAVAELLQFFASSLSDAPLAPDIAESLLTGSIGRADALHILRLRRHLSRLAVAGQNPADDVRSDPPVGHGADGPGGVEPSGDLIAELLNDPAAVSALPPHLRRPAQRVVEVLGAGRDAVRRAGAGGGGEDVLWAIWQASGLAGRWAAASAAGGSAGGAADRDLDAVVALFSAAARYADRLPQSSAGLLLEHLLAQQVPGDTLAAQAQGAQAVRILTAHAAKGLEWDVVCIAGVQEGSWPDLRPRGSLLGSEVLVDVLDGRGIVAGGSIAPLLAEERRLFYVAATRARSELVVTAVADEEEQPSRFLDELDPLDVGADGAPVPRPVGAVPRGAHLSSLVAELRAAVCDPSAPDATREHAAAQLARLAQAGVRGADPGEWWGLAPISHDGPVHPPEKGPVPVSPSRIESFVTCELRTLLHGLGGQDETEMVAASLGVLIHDIAATAPQVTDVEELERLLDERFASLDIAAPWYRDKVRQRAAGMLERYADWVRDQRSRTEFVDVERSFGVPIEQEAMLSGRVDRLERDADGRLIVIDLKTGTSAPRQDEMARHPQLGAYQLAIESGAFAESDSSAGAALVQLGRGKSAAYQPQEPLADSDEPDWARRLVLDVARRYRGAEFDAKQNDRCDRCDLARCCPVSPSGRPVTG